MSCPSNGDKREARSRGGIDLAVQGGDRPGSARNAGFGYQCQVFVGQDTSPLESRITVG
jgi:hypothetical protein